MRLSTDRRVESLLRSALVNARRGPSKAAGNRIVQVLYEEVGRQFDRGSGESLGRSLAWKAAHPLGACVPGPRILQKTGRLRNAWTGRDSATRPPQVTPRSVTIGVRGTVLPRATVFQADSPTTVRANPSNRTRSGMLAMRAALAFGPCKIWIREGRLIRGFRIDPRPVGVTRRAALLAGQIIFQDLGLGVSGA